MPGMKQIERSAYKPIHSPRGETAKPVPANCRATAPVAGDVGGKRSACPTMFHPFSRRMRQIIGRELECLLQFRVKIFECGSQLAFDPRARLRFFTLWKM